MVLRNICLMLILLLASSCNQFQLEKEILEYGSSLPNYCVNDTSALHILEDNAQEYGRALVTQGILGEWDGLLYSLMKQHFLWGDYKAVIRIGDWYSSIRAITALPEYIIAQDINEIAIDENLFQNTPYQDVFTKDVGGVLKNALTSFAGIEDVFSFRRWVNNPQGIDVILILSCRLDKGKLSELDEKVVVEGLLPLFTEGESLDKFLKFANDGAPWIWYSWLKSSLMLENYLKKSGNALFVERIRDVRKSICMKMNKTKYEQDWVNCVLQESGVFSHRN